MLTHPRSFTSFVAPCRFAALDSGIGGLATLRTLRSHLPGNHWMYAADTAYFPYGGRSVEELGARLRLWASLLEAFGVTDLLLACNSACAAWNLNALGEEFPRLRVHNVLEAGARLAVGSGFNRVGITATATTVHSDAYRKAIRALPANHPIVLTQTAAPGLAEWLEDGSFHGAEVRRIISEVVTTLLKAQVQAIVLGCTHYPLCLAEWRNAALPHGVKLLNPSRGLIARLQTVGFGRPQPGSVAEQILCSGDPELFSKAATRALGRPVTARQLLPVTDAVALLI